MNKTLFPSLHVSQNRPSAGMKLTTNSAGGKAYELTAKAALAQYCTTATFNNTYYSSAEDHLNIVKALVSKTEPEFLAKVALYSRENGKLKDLPVYILSYLFSINEIELVKKIFNRVVNNSKTLCNFVQFIRSGTHGRKSFGTAGKKLIQDWLTSRSPERLFKDSIGQSNPSLVDVIKLVHPRPTSDEQNNMFRYLMGREYSFELLPVLAQNFERTKKGEIVSLSGLDFRLLSNLTLSTAQWKEVALSMPWNTLRMNLNNVGRHGVFSDLEATKELAGKLQDRNSVKYANTFPYQLLTTYQNTQDVPEIIKTALKQAVEYATENVPNLGNVAVCVDVSGSMSHPITGTRSGATSTTKCVDVAALVASCVLRTSNAHVVTFDTKVTERHLSKFDSVLENAGKLATYGGGTACSVALRHLLECNWSGNLIFMISDNMSWADYQGGNRTEFKNYWLNLKTRNPNMKLVLLDITPNVTAQMTDDKDVLLIGGFSDAVFDVVGKFVECNGKFVEEIEGVSL